MSDPRPNILFILGDQLRARAVGCYGDAQAHTPNIDRLAGRGTRFTNAYSTYPVCTPARASIQTGLMPSSCHVVWNNQTLDPAVPCLAGQLAQADYVRAFIGKWHLGGYEGPQGEDYRFPIKPTHRHGWDDVFKVTHGEDYRPGHSPTIVGDEYALLFDEWQATWQTNEALKFIAEQDDERPWICHLNYAVPHEPYWMPERFKTMFDPDKLEFPPNAPDAEPWRQEIADYYGLTAWLDEEVGRVMEAMDARDSDRPTVILFTSDHGWNLGSHGLPAKFSLYEESACVPFILIDPRCEPGRVCDDPVSLLDVMPTLLDFADAPAPEAMEGTSIRPLLSDGGAWDRETVFMQIIEHPEHNMTRWDPPSRGVRSKRYKFIERKGGEQVLFDLDEDPWELDNVVSAPANREVVQELRAEMRRWIEKVGDPWPNSAMEGVYYNVMDNPYGEFQAHIEGDK